MVRNTLKLFMVFLVVAVIFSSAMSTAVAAKDKDKDKDKGSGGKPFKGLWDALQSLWTAIEDLQDRINETQQNPGPSGPPGLNCWDINADGTCDLETEDINQDGECTAQDCQGPQGDTGDKGEQGDIGPEGPQGPAGEDGIHCWDLNANHLCDLATEDINSDGVCNTSDCQGPPGESGEQGAEGPAGPGVELSFEERWGSLGEKHTITTEECLPADYYVRVNGTDLPPVYFDYFSGLGSESELVYYYPPPTGKDLDLIQGEAVIPKLVLTRPLRGDYNFSPELYTWRKSVIQAAPDHDAMPALNESIYKNVTIQMIIPAINNNMVLFEYELINAWPAVLMYHQDLWFEEVVVLVYEKAIRIDPPGNLPPGEQPPVFCEPYMVMNTFILLSQPGNWGSFLDLSEPIGSENPVAKIRLVGIGTKYVPGHTQLLFPELGRNRMNSGPENWRNVYRDGEPIPWEVELVWLLDDRSGVIKELFHYYLHDAVPYKYTLEFIDYENLGIAYTGFDIVG